MRVAEGVLLAGATAYAVGAQLTRPAGVPVTDTLWAEDGSVFLTEAWKPGSHERLFEAYGGYVHLLPRLLAGLVTHLPIGQAAEAVAVLSALAAAACLVLFVAGLRPWLPGPWLPAAAVAGLASLDALATEAGANLANLHWHATLALTGLVLLRLRTAPAAAAAGAAALVLALTDPYAVPLAVAALAGLAVRHRGGGAGAAARHLPVAAALVAGGVVQLLAALRRPRGPVEDSVTWAEGAEAFVAVLVAGAVPGPTALPGPAAGVAVIVVALVAGAAAAAAAAAGGQRRTGAGPGEGKGSARGRAALVAAFALAAPTHFAASVWLNQGASDRYALVPAVLLVTAVLLLPAGPAPLHAGLVAAVAAALVALAVAGWTVLWPERAGGPSFRAELVQARAECERGAAAGTAALDTTPAGWRLLLPCTELREP